MDATAPPNAKEQKLLQMFLPVSSTVEEQRPETRAFTVFLFKEATGNSFGQTVFQEWKVELKTRARGERTTQTGPNSQ